MDEFASEIRKQARLLILQLSQQEATPGIDPLIELVATLLTEEPDGKDPPMDSRLTSDQWVTWNQLALDLPSEPIASDYASAGGGEDPVAAGTDGAAKLCSLAGCEHTRPDRGGIGELEPSSAPQIADIQEGAVYAPYRVQKAAVRGARPHPANVVESSAMACVEPPNVTYRHHLPADVIVEGRVSNLQIEDVIYAGQATSVMLPNGSRKGHWNGDGTGIGKGREVYAFFYDQFEQGRTKHVHISASHQLCADAERDKSAVGVPLSIFHQADYHASEAIIDAPGIVFTTYTMLATDFSGEQERYKQLVEWLGPDFEGVIAFDEAHLMKNAATTPHGGKATVDHGTQRGNMGIALQREFPLARVRYFSATGATEARHMAPYERLGLWGAGAPFADFPAFLVAMERGGVAAMERRCGMSPTGSARRTTNCKAAVTSSWVLEAVMQQTKYNGWTNYESWCVSLWLGNTEEQYRDLQRLARAAWHDAPRSQEMKEWNWSRKDAARCQLAKAIRTYIDNEQPSESSSLFTDLTTAALAEVNWPEPSDQAKTTREAVPEEGQPAKYAVRKRSA